MKKIEINTNVNKNSINDFIKEIQKEFSEHEINEQNVIEFSLLLESNKRCVKCKGLSFCENETNGHKLIFEDDNFKYGPCRYLIEQNKKIKIVH